MARRVKLSTVVAPDVAASVHRLALARGESVSSVVADLVERAVTLQASEWGETAIVPLLEEVIRKEVSAGVGRLARLLVRTNLEAATARGLAAHLLAASPGFERDRARRVADGYWSEAVKKLSAPLDDLPELGRAAREAGSVTRSEP